ncbi:insulinase family protein [Litchfieldella rifensis]|uniref:Insulinase family protein n=1 Tax=Litchfieldella rifensis TaxID=762643 RepID=A0ABV7LSC4_9GAMM
MTAASEAIHHPPWGLPAGSRLAERRLVNGARILAIEVPTARQVRLVAAAGVGYLDEPATLPGLAHLLEHTLFLGSACHPHLGDFAAWIGDQGGRYNAHTDETVTDVHLTLPPVAAAAGLERLLDIVVRPQLARDRIAREVEVIEAEFQARLADPALHRQAALSRLYLPSHPARHCHHGHRQSLGADIDRLHAALSGFHDTHYRAERLSLVMLGPQPLERQLDQLAVAAASIPAGGGHLPKRTWRWAPPARVQWCLADGHGPTTPTLELLWPLPVMLTAMQRQACEHLVHALCDGELAATLQCHEAITDLTASLVPDADPAALLLSLELTPAGHQRVETVLATCQARMQCLATHLATDRLSVAPPSTPDHDLDDWPKALARRLAAGQSAVPRSPTEGPNAEDVNELASWLTTEPCRVLEQSPVSTAMNDIVAETRTPFRHCHLNGVSARAWPCRAPPSIEYRGLLSDSSPPIPGLIEDSDTLALWWGGGPPLADAFLGLAWPAPVAGQPTRLTRWKQRTLALRQAAAAHGLVLTLGSDGRGDWLLGRGEASRLESCLAQALAAWHPHDVAETAAPTPDGLLAQRLLARLESQPPPVHTGDRRLLVWAGGSLSAAEARTRCRRLIDSLPSTLPEAQAAAPSPLPHALPAAGDITDWPIQWLTPQGDDQALMLQVDAPDDSAASSALFQLLAQCHDAAFQQGLRQRQGLGYAAAVRYREADGWPRLGYVVQSPHADVATLRQAVCDFLASQGVALAQLDNTTFSHRRASLAAAWGAPETNTEALSGTWQALRRQKGQLAPWESQREALAALTPDQLRDLANALVTGALPGQWWAHAPSL